MIDIIDSILNKDSFSGNPPQIIVGGGVMHNSVLVGKLISRYGISLITPPCPGDPGSSIGAANFGLLCEGKKPIHSLTPFLGPGAEDLNSYPHLFNKLSTDKNSTISAINRLLEDNETIAVYTGLLEIGPRALGSRSLICNGDSREAVESLNQARKKREPFRPVAPICKKDFLSKIIAKEMIGSPVYNWMGAVIKTDPNKAGSETCLHHDGTIRVQTFIEAKENDGAVNVSLFEEILNGKFNFIGNTSFNISGDPMVFRAEDVYINMHRMGLKYIYNNGILFKLKGINA